MPARLDLVRLFLSSEQKWNRIANGCWNGPVRRDRWVLGVEAVSGGFRSKSRCCRTCPEPGGRARENSWPPRVMLYRKAVFCGNKMPDRQPTRLTADLIARELEWMAEQSLHCLSAFNPAIGKVRRLYNPRQPTSRSRTLGIGQFGAPGTD